MTAFELLSTSALHTTFKKQDLPRTYKLERRWELTNFWEVTVSDSAGDLHTLFVHKHHKTVMHEDGHLWTGAELIKTN